LILSDHSTEARNPPSLPGPAHCSQCLLMWVYRFWTTITHVLHAHREDSEYIHQHGKLKTEDIHDLENTEDPAAEPVHERCADAQCNSNADNSLTNEQTNRALGTQMKRRLIYRSLPALPATCCLEAIYPKSGHPRCEAAMRCRVLPLGSTQFENMLDA